LVHDIQFHDHVKFSGALNQEFDVSVTLFVRRKFTLKYKNTNSTGKLPAACHILPVYVPFLLTMCFTFVLIIVYTDFVFWGGLFAGFAHIPCFTVAIK
jgi:hypothetical protein